MGKETIIHSDHKPLQFIQTQGKLQNDHHHKWFTYLQQFHININYKTCISNRVVDCLSLPPVAALTIVLHSRGHEASEWPQLYQQDPEFATTYQLLGTGTNVIDFHIQDEVLCHLGHLCVSTRERAKLIWEAHYNWVVGHFGMEKLWPYFRNILIGQKFDRTSTSISDISLPMPLPSQLSRSKDYTPLFIFLRSLGNPSQWITCLACHPPSKEMTVCLWSLIDFRRWPSSQPVRIMSQQQILLSSSSNECGSNLGYHKPSSSTEETGS
jgi:hypothetical protein